MNDSRQLHESWDRTLGSLARAAQLLPEGAVESDDRGRLDRYRDWVEHNELELALHELEGLGRINHVPHEFWRHLCEAAEEMGLSSHAFRFAQKLTQA
ncbi:MAG: hypothetical protein ACKVZ0_12530 [Gemmatimonadales bacterium]